MLTRWEELPDSWVALRPASAYTALAVQTDPGSVWLALKRPLFVSFVIGCVVTLIARDAFNPWLLASITLCWGLVPLSEALGFLLVAGNERRRLTVSQACDLFFCGHTPWLLWFTMFGIIWSSQAAPAAAMFPSSHVEWYALGTAITILWSLYIDYCFFRFALQRSRWRSLGNLAVQRLVSWTLIFLLIEWAAVSCGLFHNQAR